MRAHNKSDAKTYIKKGTKKAVNKLLIAITLTIVVGVCTAIILVFFNKEAIYCRKVENVFEDFGMTFLKLADGLGERTEESEVIEYFNRTDTIKLIDKLKKINAKYDALCNKYKLTLNIDSVFLHSIDSCEELIGFNELYINIDEDRRRKTLRRLLGSINFYSNYYAFHIAAFKTDGINKDSLIPLEYRGR